MLVLPIGLWAQGDKTPISVTELSENVHRLFVNNSVAVVVFSGSDGLLIVDTGYERTSADLGEKISEVSKEPLRYIVNTHLHGDHVGGNKAIGSGVDIIAHQNVKAYMLQNDDGSRKGVPNLTFTQQMELDFNNQTLQLVHLPKGHTNSDIIIHFPESNVLVVGDLLFANYFPYVDVGNGGNPLQFLENVDWIVENFPHDVTVVGGHGPVFTIDDYKAWRDELQKTLEVLKQHKQKGYTADKMKEERLLKPWESFGKFFITEDRWIDIVYPFL